MPRQIALHICTSCRRGGAALDMEPLQQALADADLPIRVVAADCLGPCDAPDVLALEGEGRAVYVFAGVDLEDDCADVVATCRAYLDSSGGWIVDARPCGRLRFCLRTRVPPAADA